VRLTIAPLPKSTAHRRPPALVMPRALGERAPVRVKSVGFAGSAVEILRTLSLLAVQRLPSGPVTIACGVMMSLTVKAACPAGFAGGIRTSFVEAVTHRLPSGPVVMPFAPVTPVSGTSVFVPSGVNRASALPPMITQMLPSDPCASFFGESGTS
jgi:hypothetical protein